MTLVVAIENTSVSELHNQSMRFKLNEQLSKICFNINLVIVEQKPTLETKLNAQKFVKAIHKFQSEIRAKSIETYCSDMKNNLAHLKSKFSKDNAQIQEKFTEMSSWLKKIEIIQVDMKLARITITNILNFLYEQTVDNTAMNIISSMLNFQQRLPDTPENFILDQAKGLKNSNYRTDLEKIKNGLGTTISKELDQILESIEPKPAPQSLELNDNPKPKLSRSSSLYGKKFQDKYKIQGDSGNTAERSKTYKKQV